jgi:pimeloyl-ACP methyl ester carboxylesterase
MSNNTEINNRDQDINALKLTINNLKQENKQLLESNEQMKIVHNKLRDFINIAAHELRTPIMPILSVLEISEYDLEGAGGVGQLEGKNEVVLTKQQFQCLKYNANRLEKLAFNILDLAKIENKTLSLNKEQFSLVDVITDSTQEFQREIKITDKKLQLVIHIDVREQDQQQKQQQRFMVKADKNRIIQVIYNLLNNALKFAESKVYVTIEKDCNNAVITVKDDGGTQPHDHLAEIVNKFIAQIGLERFSIYVMDYGAPIGYRLAVKNPEKIEALIVQNGNAYDEGLGEFWEPLKAYWSEPNEKNKDALMKFLTIEATKWQYTHGVRNENAISPDNWILDQSLLDRPGNKEIQLQLFFDYRSNPPLYPQWQEYFRKYQPPILVVWGRNDYIFLKEGAIPYQRDLKNIEVHLLDTGHFALEEEGELIAELISRFLTTRRYPIAKILIA